jgi:hypothetical protein
LKTGLLKNGTAITYASGLVVNEFKGATEISHSGATAGYRAWMAYYPKDDLSIVLLSNDAGFNASSIGRDAVATLIGKTESKPFTTRPGMSLTAEQYKNFEGIYRSVRHFDVQQLQFKDGKIMKDDRQLEGAHRDTLFLDDLKWVKTGTKTILVHNGDDTLTYRKIDPPIMNPGSLLSLQGTYYSEEAEASYQINIAGKEVWLKNQHFPAAVLTPVFKDGFSMNENLYEFRRNRRGQVIAVDVSTSRAEQIRFVKTDN